MLASEIKINGRYGMKTGKLEPPIVDVKIVAVHPLGGWLALNLATRRTIRLRSASRIAYDLDVIEAQQEAHDKARATIARLIAEQASQRLK